jgi:hypothetical protein
LKGEAIDWINAIGPQTQGKIEQRIKMSETGKPGVVLSIVEVTTTKDPEKILTRGRKVGTWAAVSRNLGLSIKSALVIDQDAYLKALSPAEQRELVSSVTSSGGYIILVEDFTKIAVQRARILTQELRLQR